MSRRSLKKVPRCLGKKRDGDPCMREAGWGTDHIGTGRCKHHGGSSPQGRIGAGREEAKLHATSLPVSPGQAVLGVLHQQAGQLAYASFRVGELDDILDDQGRPEPWYRLQRDLQDRVVKSATNAAAMGVAERRTDLLEEQTRQMGELMEAVMGDIGLTAAQRKKVGPAIRRHIEGTARLKEGAPA
jgi:hypothetical protein